MSNKKPRPLNSRPPPNLCPICGEASYSRAGVHPQCSARQADEKRKDHIKREKLAAEATPISAGERISAWQKICPKCKAVQHIRKKICSCGASLESLARPPNSDRDLS